MQRINNNDPSNMQFETIKIMQGQLDSRLIHTQKKMAQMAEQFGANGLLQTICFDFSQLKQSIAQCRQIFYLNLSQYQMPLNNKREIDQFKYLLDWFSNCQNANNARITNLNIQLSRLFSHAFHPTLPNDNVQPPQLKKRKVVQEDGHQMTKARQYANAQLTGAPHDRANVQPVVLHNNQLLLQNWLIQLTNAQIKIGGYIHEDLSTVHAAISRKVVNLSDNIYSNKSWLASHCYTQRTFFNELIPLHLDHIKLTYLLLKSELKNYHFKGSCEFRRQLGVLNAVTSKQLANLDVNVRHFLNAHQSYGAIKNKLDSLEKQANEYVKSFNCIVQREAIQQQLAHMMATLKQNVFIGHFDRLKSGFSPDFIQQLTIQMQEVQHLASQLATFDAQFVLNSLPPFHRMAAQLAQANKQLKKIDRNLNISLIAENLWTQSQQHRNQNKHTQSASNSNQNSHTQRQFKNQPNSDKKKHTTQPIIGTNNYFIHASTFIKNNPEKHHMRR